MNRILNKIKTYVKEATPIFIVVLIGYIISALLLSFILINKYDNERLINYKNKQSNKSAFHSGLR